MRKPRGKNAQVITSCCAGYSVEKSGENSGQLIMSLPVNRLKGIQMQCRRSCQNVIRFSEEKINLLTSRHKAC